MAFCVGLAAIRAHLLEPFPGLLEAQNEEKNIKYAGQKNQGKLKMREVRSLTSVFCGSFTLGPLMGMSGFVLSS